MKRLSLIFLLAAVLVVIFLVLFWAFRERIAMSLFSRTIHDQVTADIVIDLPDGLHAASCGSGTPLPDLTQAGGCLAIIAGKHLFVIDIGDGAPKTLSKMGLRPSRIEAVFLTHFHSDHIAGLGSIALQRNLGNSINTPLPLYGGPGVERVASGFNEAFALDHAYRIAHHKTLSVPTVALQLEPHPFTEPGEGVLETVYAKNEVLIRAFLVPHGPVRPAIGYRVDYKGRSIVVSGDTKSSTNLIAAAGDADLLVHEALNPEMVAIIENEARAAGQETLATVMHDIPSYHSTPVEAADAARQAGVKQLAFTHMIPPLPTKLLEGVFLAGVAKHYSGPVQILHDGDVILLPASGGLTQRKLLP